MRKVSIIVHEPPSRDNLPDGDKRWRCNVVTVKRL